MIHSHLKFARAGQDRTGQDRTMAHTRDARNCSVTDCESSRPETYADWKLRREDEIGGLFEAFSFLSEGGSEPSPEVSRATSDSKDI